MLRQKKQKCNQDKSQNREDMDVEIVNKFRIASNSGDFPLKETILK